MAKSTRDLVMGPVREPALIVPLTPGSRRLRQSAAADRVRVSDDGLTVVAVTTVSPADRERVTAGR